MIRTLDKSMQENLDRLAGMLEECRSDQEIPVGVFAEMLGVVTQAYRLGHALEDVRHR